MWESYLPSTVGDKIINWIIFVFVVVVVLCDYGIQRSSSSVLYCGLRQRSASSEGRIYGKDAGRTYKSSIVLAPGDTTISIPFLMSRS